MVKDRSQYGTEIVESSPSAPPYEKLKSMNLKKDFETLKVKPINQPVVEFIEKIERINEDIIWDQDNELRELLVKYNSEFSKEYNKDLEIVRIFHRIKLLYERQINKLMDMPDICAETILDILKIKNE